MLTFVNGFKEFERAVDFERGDFDVSVLVVGVDSEERHPRD